MHYQSSDLQKVSSSAMTWQTSGLVICLETISNWCGNSSATRKKRFQLKSQRSTSSTLGHRSILSWHWFGPSWKPTSWTRWVCCYNIISIHVQGRSRVTLNESKAVHIEIIFFFSQMYLHSPTADMEKVYAERVPRSSLPSDYGGSGESIIKLQEQLWSELLDAREFYLFEEKQARLELEWEVLFRGWWKVICF